MATNKTTKTATKPATKTSNKPEAGAEGGTLINRVDASPDQDANPAAIEVVEDHPDAATSTDDFVAPRRGKTKAQREEEEGDDE